MASLIPGFEYDIFISYRQKDNKGDRWVSEFVEALKTELESTFKEEISVYFDINPHDGLLETYDVDASLKEKLKCLVFIPIISRTYCDPKSFAWKNEFKAFVEQASQDQFGLKVKLPNGNVASRVLPIQIHDLKSEDKMLVEKELGGYIRAIEFIFKESGVNRPLTLKDSEDKNTNKTNYRNQINKVANAIDEITSGLMVEPTLAEKEKPQHKVSMEEARKEERKEAHEKPAKLSNRKLLTGGIILAVLLAIAAIIAYPKIFNRDTLDKLRSSGERISVAVMPFQNLTNDTIWNVWQDGIQDILINNLTNSEELVVRQIESISDLLQSKGLTNYASITPTIASDISQKLETNIFIYGSIKQVGTTIRLNAQLIDNKTEEIYKAFQIDGIAGNILRITDSLSIMLKNFIIISKLGKQATLGFQNPVSTNSPEAYRFFLFGNNAYSKKDYSEAIKMYLQAKEKDSNYIDAQIRIPFAFGNQGLYKQEKEWCLKLYAKRDKMTLKQKIYLNYIYADCFETPYESIKYLNQLKELDNQNPNVYYNLGVETERVYQFDKAIPEFVKSLEIYNKWNSKPLMVDCYTELGYVYHKTGQYKEEKKLYKQAEKDFIDDPTIMWNQAILSLVERDIVSANRYFKKLITGWKDNSTSEAAISTNLAIIYLEAGITDQAEIYLRKALALEPENRRMQSILAYFLINKNRNVNEGLELIDKALELSPEDYVLLDTKGWGLYKQGKYQEALEILQKSWDLRMKKAIYDHEAFLHLEEAKKAVADLKNN